MREHLLLPNGKVIYQVPKRMYVKYERIRNYILRLQYEWNAPRWLAQYRAMSRYKIGEKEIRRAMYEWKKWYYDNGVRHKPIEMFIEEEKKKSPKVYFS